MPSSGIKLELGINSGNDLLSRKLDKHYHRSYGVSLPCSGWERVGPPRKDHQTIRIQNLKFEISKFPGV
jgi:hypothetical protein